MNKATELIENQFNPIMVLSLYATDRSDYSGDYYIESHEVDGKGRVLAGKPLAHETMDAILKGFEDSRIKTKLTSGAIPPGLLYANVELQQYIWIVEPRKRILYFKKDLGIPNGEAFVPKMLFHAEGNSLHVFAVKSVKGKNAILYRAPFHNVGDLGDVCLGSAKTTKKGNDFKAMLDYWETIFFASEFTHINGGNPINGNVNTMWKKLIKSGAKFDNKVLKPTSSKVIDLYP